ncbi:MAG: GreA/GreB family elongation factor [Steroidobacteraceae bacterium]
MIPDLLLTSLDVVRLARVLHKRPDTAFAERLELAAVVPSERIAPDVITMNSRIVLGTLPAGDDRVVTLVYPDHGVISSEFVSVLSPLGRVLLGARCGDEVHATLPDGRERRFLIRRLEYQPEAAGDWHV